MSAAPLPEYVTRQQLLDVCDTLGLDPDRVGAVRLDPNGVLAEVWDPETRQALPHYMGLVQP